MRDAPECSLCMDTGGIAIARGQARHPYYHLWEEAESERRNARYFFRDLFSQPTLRDFFRRLLEWKQWGFRNWGQRHFYTFPCPECSPAHHPDSCQ